MAITIAITNLQKRLTLPTPLLKRIARRILKTAGISKGQLSLVFVTDKKIHGLNKKFLGQDCPTDVLAFDWREREGSSSIVHRPSFSAEIIISTDTAVRQAREYSTTPQQELALYIVHGILHLLGYDDRTVTDKRRMRQRERENMEKIKEDCHEI